MSGARQLLLTATILMASNGGAWAQSRIEWVGSWQEAQALAAQHHRLVLVHFWSPDCAPCAKLDRTVLNQPECVRAVATNYVAWKVNVADNPTVTRDFRVDRWPTDVVLTPTGQELYRGASPLELNRFIATFDQIAAHARLGMTIGADAGPDAMLASTPTAANSPSNFPAGQPMANATYQPATSYPPPTSYQGATSYPPPTSYQGATSYQPSTGNQPMASYAPPTGYQPPAGPPASAGYPPPTGNQSGHTVYGPPAFNPPTSPYNVPAAAGQPNAPPAGQPGVAAPQSPAYVTNQWIAPASTAGQPAEQRASYTASYGGEFRPPAGAAPTGPVVGMDGASSSLPGAPSAPAFGTPVANTTNPGPPANDVTVTPPSATVPSFNSSTLGPPTNVAQPPAPPAADVPAVGLDGYCPVTLVEKEKWVKGDPKWGARHRGRLYFFISPEAQQRFLDNYDKYAPALSGYDPVKYGDQGALVDGKRAHGVFYRSQIYLFADEAALQQFWTAPERYAATVRAEQERSAMRGGEVQR